MKRLSKRQTAIPSVISPRFWGGFLGHLLGRLKDKITPKVMREYSQKVKARRQQQTNYSQQEEQTWSEVLGKLSRDIALSDKDLQFVASAGESVGEDFSDFLQRTSETGELTYEPEEAAEFPRLASRSK